MAPPLEAVRDRLVDQVNARSGRTLVVAGPASLSLYPHAVVSFMDVTMLGPGGKEAAPIATVPTIDIEVSLWSLLLRQPQVGRLTLHRPTINLTVDADGRRNWEPAGVGRKRAPAAARDARGNGAPAEPAPRTRSVAGAERLSGGSVRILDGTLRYRDERSGVLYEVGSLDLVVTATDGGGSTRIDGTVEWRGVEVGFSASPVRAILGDEPVRLSVNVSGAPIEAAYEGTATVGGAISADGKVSVNVASIRGFRDWLAGAQPAGPGADALALSTHMAFTDDQVALSSLEASLGDVTMAGSLSVGIKGRPKVTGKLRLSELDLGKMLARRGKRAAAAPPLSSGHAALPAPNKRAGGAGWSEEAIDAQLLALADVELDLSVGRVVYKGMKMGKGRLSVGVEAGLAKVVLEDVELYGGRGKGNLTLDGRGPVLAVGANLELAGVSVLPLLEDAGGVGWLDGRGTATLALSGRGVSERELVESLNGKVDVAVADGAVTGVDVGKVVRNVQRGRLASLAPAPEDRTEFSELEGTFDVASGIAKSRDLRLVGAHLQLRGEGEIELGPRRIDYALRAKITGSPPGEGDAVRIGTLEIPIGIKGPLASPTFSIMGQEALGDAVRRIGKNLRTQEVQDAIEGLLSGDREKRVDPRKLIEKLLE